MNSPINNGSIKLACIQTVPGYEHQVKERLEEACNTIGIKKFVFLKCFGAFDIILLYSGSDYDFNLSKAGPIPYILKSNILLCYSHLTPKKIDGMFQSLRTTTFSGVSLLKINPNMQSAFPKAESAIRVELSSRLNYFLLCSLGWNELILIICNNDPNHIVDDFFSISKTGIPKYSFLFIKTLSFLCLSYDHIPPQCEIQKGINAIVKHFDKTATLAELVIDPNTSRSLPFIEVSSKPGYAADIKKYFSAKGFNIYETLGRQDLILDQTKKMKWSHLISSILFFRYKFKTKLFSTSVRFKASIKANRERSCHESPVSLPTLKFSYETLKDIYGELIASGLSNDFYSFNSLIQNPIYGNIFLDMSKYPQYMIEVGQKFPSPNIEFVRTARDVLKYGAEIRSYGTFDTIEEVKNRFSEIRGGAQRALLAIEYLPSSIFKRLNKEDWYGFIIAGNYKLLVTFKR